MFLQKLRKKSFSDEEEDSDLIINNDEFCTLNDFKTNEENLYRLNKNKKISKNINSTEKKKNSQNNCIILKNPKVPKLTNDKINNNLKDDNNNNIIIYENHLTKINNNEEKTIFSKITEDLYLDSLNNIKPNKLIFDLNKKKDDNYHKLTVENYLFTCADKENSKNKKIISDFIERKNKEHICKKIAINQKNNNKNWEEVEKKYSSDHKKMKRTKCSRSPEQFLDDQKIMEEKHKTYIDNLIKMHNEELKLCFKDRPTISKQSEKLANMNKNTNKNIHLKLYEEFNIRKKNNEQKNKNTFIISEYDYNKRLDNEQIIENAKRLYKEYEKKKNNYNENQMKQLNDIKILSSNTLMNKNSCDIISKRFINIYKNVLNELFKKDISDIFDFTFEDFLLFIYKLGLVDKNYNNINIMNNKTKIKNNINNTNIMETPYKSDKKEKIDIKQFSYRKKELNNDRIRNISPEEEKNRKNKMDFSYKILKKNIFKTKSAEKKPCASNENINLYEPEYKLAREAWQIITKSKTFNEDMVASSKIVLLFFLSLCGIYKGNINDIFIKKEFPFLLNNQSDLINIQTANQIHKYFFLYRNAIINKVFEKSNPKKKDSDIRNIELNKFERNSKSFVKRSYNNNFNHDKDKDKENIFKRNKKILNISKNKTGYKSVFNIKNKLNLNSYKDNDENINNSPNKNKNKKKKILKVDINKYKNDMFRIKNAATARYQNKLSKNINLKNNEKKENILNEYVLKRNLKKIAQNHNSNTSFNSNSLFSQNVYEPKLNRKDNNKNIDKSNNGEHVKEKKSSISQYIFNEDYRIKDDIESNSNFNDNEINKENKDNKEKNINQNINENIEQNKIYNNTEEDNNYRKISNSNLNKSSLNEELSNTNKNSKNGEKKKKFIFKIKIKDEMIKLVINKGDDIYYKINEFCKENDLDEDDKEQIIEVVNLKLLGTD